MHVSTGFCQCSCHQPLNIWRHQWREAPCEEFFFVARVERGNTNYLNLLRGGQDGGSRWQRGDGVKFILIYFFRGPEAPSGLKLQHRNGQQLLLRFFYLDVSVF